MTNIDAGSERAPRLRERIAARLHRDEVQAQRVLAFVLGWAITTRMLGHEPSTNEYAAWWGVTRTQPPRQMRRFRRAFPEYTTPSGLIEAIEKKAPGALAGGVAALAELRL